MTNRNDGHANPCILVSGILHLDANLDNNLDTVSRLIKSSKFKRPTMKPIKTRRVSHKAL